MLIIGCDFHTRYQQIGGWASESALAIPTEIEHPARMRVLSERSESKELSAWYPSPSKALIYHLTNLTDVVQCVCSIRHSFRCPTAHAPPPPAHFPTQSPCPQCSYLCVLSVKKTCFLTSLFVSITSALFSATARSQPLSHLSLAHSFPFNRGVSLCSYFLFPLFHFPVLSNLLFFSNFPYALPSYVYRKSFVCHSCENYRGGGVCFPFWNSAPSIHPYLVTSLLPYLGSPLATAPTRCAAMHLSPRAV